VIILGDIESIYRNLQKHLDSMPVGFPKSESRADIRLLKAYFTPREAEFALFLDFAPVPLENIFEKLKQKGYSIDDVRKILDSMDKKRIISKVVNSKTGQTMYRNEPFAIGFYEWHVNRLTKEMAEATEEYFKTYANEIMGVKTGSPQLRVIPIEAALTHENNVMSYDSVRKILESVEEPYIVSPCVCTQQKELIGKPCKHDFTERCITNSKTYLEQGNGREITLTELNKILDRAEEEGLVIQPGNAKNVGGFCLCCGDCCGIISNAKMLEKPARFFATNYYSEVDMELCSVCGTCVERCPMDAISMDEYVIIDLDRCIGCGSCVVGCPSEALRLKNKEIEVVPPDDFGELYKKLAIEKSKL
jgi:ferredoxin